MINHEFASCNVTANCSICGCPASASVHRVGALTDEQLTAIADRDDDETITRMAKELQTARSISAIRENIHAQIVVPRPGSAAKIDSTTDIRYRDRIHEIAQGDAERLLKKDVEYGASWKKRGGVGAYFTMIRKVDRLNTQIPSVKHGYDIFETLMDPTPGDESLLDTLRDLRGYLILIEAEVLARTISTQ